jgi:DNA repair exonuclease SbcCD ATPase subunit
LLPSPKKAEDLKNQIENSKPPLGFKNPLTLQRAVSALEALYKDNIDLNAESKEFDLTLRINEAQRDVENQNIELGDLKRQLREIPEKCDKCGAHIPKTKRMYYRKKINEQIKAVFERTEEAITWLNGLKRIHEKLKAQLAQNEKWEKKLDILKSKKQKYAKIELEQVRFEENQKSQWAIYYNILQQIEDIKKEKSPIKDIKKQKENVANAYEKWILNRNRKQEIAKSLRIDKWLIKDPLSNNGLKAFIFESMVGKINAHLKTYKSLVGFDIKVGVDLKSSRKNIDLFITKKGDEIPVDDLSGGQGQMAGVVALFAFADTVQDNKPINILLMDEAFESLDKNNIALLEAIIMKKAKSKSIHLITHNDNFNPIGAYKTILELKEGITQQYSKYHNN